jgi:hypothetical protein
MNSINERMPAPAMTVERLKELSQGRERIFGKKAFQFLKEKGLMPLGVKLACIDGRRTDIDEGESANKNIEICVPGGGLGVLMDIHTAVEKISGQKISKDLSDKILNLVSKFMNAGEEGPISAHTDDHHHDAEDSFYSGCGHCVGIAKNDPAHGYDTTEALSDFANNLNPNNFDTITYKGNHAEKGVINIVSTDRQMDTYIGDEKELQVFVYNSSWHKEILMQLAKKIASELEELDRVEAEELYKIVSNISGDRTSATVKRLAKGLNMIEI